MTDWLTDWLTDLINQSRRCLYSKQPLALPGSANKHIFGCSCFVPLGDWAHRWAVTLPRLDHKLWITCQNLTSSAWLKGRLSHHFKHTYCSTTCWYLQLVYKYFLKFLLLIDLFGHFKKFREIKMTLNWNFLKKKPRYIYQSDFH